MAYLGNTPMLETASPFSTPPTLVQTSLSDIRKSLVIGIGSALGLAIGGFLLHSLLGSRRVSYRIR